MRPLQHTSSEHTRRCSAAPPSLTSSYRPQAWSAAERKARVSTRGYARAKDRPRTIAAEWLAHAQKVEQFEWPRAASRSAKWESGAGDKATDWWRKGRSPPSAPRVSAQR